MTANFVELQQAMKIQSEDLRDALADLSKWEKEVNGRPVAKTKPVAADIPPVRGTAPAKKAEPAKPKVDPMQTAKEEGNEYFKRGDIEQAIRCYTKGIDVDPQNASTHVLYANRAQCYIKQRKWEDAEKDATISLQMNRAYSKSFFRRAVARKGLKKYKEARSDLETVLALQQGDVEATNELKEVTQLLREAEAAAASAAPAGGAAPARKKLVIKEVDEDDEDEKPAQPSAAPNRHVDPSAASSTSPNREQLEAAKKQTEEEARLEKARQERISRDNAHLAEQQKMQAEQRRLQSLKEEELKQRQRRANPRVEEVEDEPVPARPSPAKTTTAASSQSQPRASVSVPSVKVQAWTKDKLKTPKNFTEFERVYADIRLDNELLDALISLIAPSSFKTVFGSSLTPEILVDLLESAKRSTAVRAKELLEGLAGVSRIDELVMFFEAKEKALVTDVFSLVANSGAAKAVIDKLRSKFVA